MKTASRHNALMGDDRKISWASLAKFQKNIISAKPLNLSTNPFQML